MLITKTAFLRKNILTGAMEVVIHFPFNQEDLKIVRSIPGRKFIVTAKSQGSKNIGQHHSTAELYKSSCRMGGVLIPQRKNI